MCVENVEKWFSNIFYISICRNYLKKLIRISSPSGWHSNWKKKRRIRLCIPRFFGGFGLRNSFFFCLPFFSTFLSPSFFFSLRKRNTFLITGRETQRLLHLLLRLDLPGARGRGRGIETRLCYAMRRDAMVSSQRIPSKHNKLLGISQGAIPSRVQTDLVQDIRAPSFYTPSLTSFPSNFPMLHVCLSLFYLFFFSSLFYLVL